LYMLGSDQWPVASGQLSVGRASSLPFEDAGKMPALLICSFSPVAAASLPPDIPPGGAGILPAIHPVAAILNRRDGISTRRE